MKKIGLVLLIASIWFVSCDERYEEERGAVLEGTWELSESYIGDVIDTLSIPKFLIARKLEGENLLLFYSRGYYDSSFVYRIQNNAMYIRRVLDSVDVIHRYYKRDSSGNYVLDASDTVKEPQKPLKNIQTTESGDRYYGTISFPPGTQITLVIERYLVDSKGEPINKLYGRDIYKRPDNKE
jgi:hypothetical protein